MFGENETYTPKNFTDATTLKVTSVFYTIQGEGPYAGHPAVFVRLAHCNLTCSFCFVGSTKIRMGDGTKKRIDEVKIGDSVMSWNGEGFEPKPVVNTFRRRAPAKLLRVEAEGPKLIWCTAEHPFLVSGKGWVQAQNLVPGVDVLVNYDASTHMRMFNPMKPERRNFTPWSCTEAGKEHYSKIMKRTWADNPRIREAVMERMTSDNPMKQPEIAAKGLLARVANGNLTISGMEKRFLEVCEGLPIKYVGDGALIINNLCPDFIVEGTKKLIEIWPSGAGWSYQRDDAYIARRRALLEKEGYEVLFLAIGQEDFRKKTGERNALRGRVAEFIHNGATVRYVEEITPKGRTALFNGRAGYRPEEVYNIEVADTHTYVANDLVVHNCDSFFDEGDIITIDEVLQRIKNCEPPDLRTRLLVITGGEPTLQSGLLSLLRKAVDRGYKTQIETNGNFYLPFMPTTHVVVSPKINEKTGRFIKVNAALLRNHVKTLKFVVSADPTSPYHKIPDFAFEWRRNTPDPRQIYVSPMNIYKRRPEPVAETATLEGRSQNERISFWTPGLLDREQNQANHEYAASLAMKYGLILTLQMHLYASVP